MAKTKAQIAKELESIKQQALKIQTVLNERGEVDVSEVPEGVEPVQLPETNLRDLSIAFSGKADETTMAEIESRDPDLVARARQFQNTGSFVTDSTPVEEPQTETDKLASEAETIRGEIRTLEEKMANRGQRQSDAYDEAGIFDDMRALNELKARQREIQDREIEIPIEGRQKLRGKMATKTDFNQLTRPAIEKNLLNQLASSRATSRLSDTITTNLAVVDAQLKAEVERDEFLYKKKIDRLNTVQQAYADIVTEEQKEAIEFQKFQYDLLRDASKADADLRNDLITGFVESGGAQGMTMDQLMNMSSDELLSKSYETTSPYNWTNLTPEQAAVLLPEDEFKRYETLQEWKKTASEEEQAVVNQKAAVQQTANSTIDLIEGMLDDKAGLKTSVGEGALARADFSVPFTSIGKESSKFRARLKKLMSQATLDKLLELKAAGGTLGAISEKELAILQNAAVELGSVETKDGKPSGKSNLSEEDFRTALETMRMASMKVYIAESIGKKAYDEAGFVNLEADVEGDFETVEKMYQDLKTNPPGKVDYSSQELRSEQNLDTAYNKIRQEEGFRSDAYQDSTGTWTIGFGTTTVNGRPVQPGDRLTEAQSESLMRNQVIEKYTTFADTVNTEMTPNQFAALTSFEYNLGSGVWNTDTGRRILSLISDGQNQEAGQLMLQYHKSRNPQTGELEYNNVLAQRRMREANLLLS